MVLEEGVLEGRKVFANILKYIRMGGQLELRQHVQRARRERVPAVPADAPIQILTNNLLYDFSQIADPDRRRGRRSTSPSRGSGTSATSRASCCFIGPISSIFDYTTFFVMLYVFGAGRRRTRRCSRPAGSSNRC